MTTPIHRTPTPDTSRYRPNAGLVVRNRKGLVFTAERAGKPGAWQLPQGGIDEGENPLDAALREFFEETGIPATDLKLVKEMPDWIGYNLPQELLKGSRLEKMGLVGQCQKWFLFDYVGDDSTIDLTKAHDHEFDSWAWRPAAEIVELTIAFRKPVYRTVLDELLK
ncbi:MAG: RNA pyrophosphohydrolase [Proteobacteria bacterium]|nr:RNA pyrophosphohydrolase [Pseudomonadota bacterium]